MSKSEVKDFQRTMRDAEQKIKDHLAMLNKKEAASQIYSSCGVLENSIDKVVNLIGPEYPKELAEQIDNIYYHIGKIKGCV